MAEEPKDEEFDDGEGEAEELAKLNPELLAACMRNDTDAAIALMEQGADPCCEDSRQWSPLIWAAQHGNDTLTRLLIQKGAAEVYKYDETPGIKVKKKKHSPLHWAAFKGNINVLWLLMAPPQNLSHHERDAIGNTPLHQAAAGGSLECAKCLMAQGVDVFAKNDRGHTPYALCTVPEVQILLDKAMKTVACKATGKQFSATVLRYLCTWSLEVFCDSAVNQIYVYEHPDSTEKEQPVTWCNEVKNTIQEAEHQLNHAYSLNQLEAVTDALEAAEDKPVDCRLVFQCSQLKAKLESEIMLENSTQVQVVTSLDEFTGIHEELNHAIDNAERKGADAAMVASAKTLRRRLMSEAALMRAVQGKEKTTPGHITMLQELTKAAIAESANEELITTAEKLIAKLTSEAEVLRRLAITAPLSALSSFKEAAGKEEGYLPPWALATEEFETWHEEYKEVVELATTNQISPELLTRALEQLEQIELLLVEKKRLDEEDGLKKAKKKGKK